MSREEVKHAVRLDVGADAYNVLIAALKLSQSCSNKLITEHANALLAKIKRYTRRYSENDKEYAEIRFFESEARNLIWLLLAVFACYSSDDEDYYHADNHAG